MDTELKPLRARGGVKGLKEAATKNGVVENTMKQTTLLESFVVSFVLLMSPLLNTTVCY